MNKKFLSVAASAAIVASTLVFTGCGSDDSSSSGVASPAGAGAKTGTFIKGLWSGIPYTYANGTKSATTGANGTFTYNTGDWVLFDLGLIKANVTAPAAVVSVVDPTGITLTDANSSAVITTNSDAFKNYLTALLVLAGNQSTIEAATGYDATDAIKNMKKLAANGLKTTSTAFVSDMDLKMQALNITANSAKGGIAPYAVNTALTDNLANAIQEMVNAKKAAVLTNAASGGTLNTTRLNNTAIVFNDGTYLKLSFGPGRELGTNISIGESSYDTKQWNASGSMIMLGSTNMSNFSVDNDYIVFSGAPAKGTVATFTTGKNGTQVQKTVSAVYANLWQLGTGGRSLNVTVPQFALNVTGNSTTNDTLIASMTLANGTTYYTNSSENKNESMVTGAYNQTLMLNFYNISNAKSPLNQTNLTFDADPFTSGNTATGFFETILVSISSTVQNLANYVKVVLTKLGIV